MSPIKKRKLAAPTYAPAKLKKVEEKLEKLFEAGGAPSFTLIKSREALFYEKVISALQEKFKSATTVAEKIMVVSVALVGLSRNKVLELFGPLGASEWLLKQTTKLSKEQGLLPKALPKKGRSLPEETIECVKNFYESDDNSRQLPGKKDYVSIRINGEKKQIQKKLLLVNLKELYRLFKDTNPSHHIKFSKFASLRPPQCVFAGSPGTHSVCVCKYHENVKLLIEGADFKSLDPSLTTYLDILECALCNPPSATCYLEGCCSKCPGLENLQEHLLDLLSENGIEEIVYKQWSAVDRSSLETYTKEISPFMETLVHQMKELLPHHFVSKMQAKYLRELKEDLKPGEVVTIADFSENMTFIIQGSIQSYYFENAQATVHPFVSYYKDGENLCVLSLVVVSDYLKHNIETVYAFQKKLVQHAKENVPGLKIIHYFSDGATSQYKNCFNMMNLSHHEEDFGIKAEWNFFATSHGKGPSDGVGGNFKRAAARASIQGTLINSAKSLYEWADTHMSSIKTVYVTSEEILETKAFLKERYQNVIQVEQIRSLHHFAPVGKGALAGKKYSLAEDSQFCPVELVRQQLEVDALTSGSFVAVRLRQKSWYIAEVQDIDKSTNEVLAVRLLGKRVEGMLNICKFILMFL